MKDSPKNLIVEQELLPDGVLTTYQNGSKKMLPYEKDEQGRKFVELFPNEHKGGCFKIFGFSFSDHRKN